MRPLPALVLALLAALQLLVFNRPVGEGAAFPFFLFGTDTMAHDAVVHQWVRLWALKEPLTIPLWAPELHGGLPTLGAFLWTPFAPPAWAFPLMPYAWAQLTAWWAALWIGGLCAFSLGRSLRMGVRGALLTGAAWMLCGHVVTLIHAGHFQKVMALGWLPLALAGAAHLVRARGGARRLAAGFWRLALAVGMMLLSGHPQIAWLGMAGASIVVAFGLFVVGARAPRIAALMLAIATGLCFGGAQLLPGLEMSGLSNRAAGVSFEEAIETSYPPGELGEYLVPRIKGSSVMGDVYTGEWGERIVSDFPGGLFLLLAVVGFFLARKRATTWGIASFGCFFLIVGLGGSTFLYGLLYRMAPGFSSFRSPGTFMAATSLMIAVGAGLASHRLLKSRGRALVYLSILLLASAEVMWANRFFLIAFPYERYEREYLSPTTLDLHFAETNSGLSVHDAAADTSLRPILFGRRSLLAYHPITYAARDHANQQTGLNTREWVAANGVSHVIVPGLQADADLRFEPGPLNPAEAPRSVYTTGIAPGLVLGDAVESAEWTVRTPNRRVVRVRMREAGTVIFPENSTRDHQVRLESTPLPRQTTAVSLSTTLELPAGESVIEWVYTPAAYRAGLLASGIGLMLIMAAMRYSKRAVPTRTTVAPSSIATS